MPVATNRNRKLAKKPGRFAACTDHSTAAAPRANMAKLTAVTRAPPSRSDSHPPNGRASDPMPAPRKAHVIARPPLLNTVFNSVGNAAEYPLNEPKVPMYSSERIQVSEWRSYCHTGATSALASVRLFMPRYAQTAATTASET